MRSEPGCPQPGVVDEYTNPIAPSVHSVLWVLSANCKPRDEWENPRKKPVPRLEPGPRNVESIQSPLMHGQIEEKHRFPNR